MSEPNVLLPVSIVDEITALRARLAQAESKSDAEMERVKACEHIALGDDGWQVLRNLCPSTAAVAWLRDQLVVAESRAAQAEAENAVMVGALTAMCVACDPSICSGAMLAAYHRAREALTHTTEGARRLLDVVNAALEMHHSDDAFHWAGRNIELRSAVQKLSAQSNKVEGQ